MIIALCSQTAQVGKDTAAQFFVENLNCTRVAFADDLKNICELMGYDDRLKLTEPRHRQLLIDIGLAGRRFDINLWTDIARKKIDSAITFGRNVVISDVRFVSEIEYLKHNYGKVKVIGIESNTFGNKSLINDESQIEYNSMKKDFIIYNNDTLIDFYKKLNDIVCILRGDLHER